MKTIIDIPENELYFIEVPEIYTNFKIMNYGYAGTYLMETDSKSLNHWQMKIPNGNYEIIGYTKKQSLSFYRENKNFVLRRIRN